MSEIPPKSYTQDFDTPRTVECQVIGRVRSPYKERYGTPFQASRPGDVPGGRDEEAVIELDPDPRLRDALADLEGFDYVWVLAWMHLNKGWRPRVAPPRAPEPRRGLFSTRSPHRPNPISLSALRLVRVEGREIHVRGLDLLDGTPVLDVKPYVPYADAFPDARAGWLDRP